MKNGQLLWNHLSMVMIMTLVQSFLYLKMDIYWHTNLMKLKVCLIHIHHYVTLYCYFDCSFNHLINLSVNQMTVYWIHSFSHSFIQSLTCSFIHLLIHSLTHLFTFSFIYLPIEAFHNSFIHSLISFSYIFIYFSFLSSSLHPTIYSLFQDYAFMLLLHWWFSAS